MSDAAIRQGIESALLPGRFQCVSESPRLILDVAHNPHAAAYLASCGLREISRNFRVRGGEIDLIFRDGKVLVFVEVRQRSNRVFGGAAASITAEKQRRIILAAQHYLAAQRQTETPCRFDCVLIDGETPLEWLRDAFHAC